MKSLASTTQSSWVRERLNFVALICIFGMVTAMFLTSPQDGEFWWSEAPRNALNGAFVMDLLFAFPIDDPVGWATRYYMQYPSLTILFYPPMLHVVLALFYMVLGVEHWVSIVCLMTFYFAFATGVYAVGRRWLSPVCALGFVLALTAAPEVALWGRQIMLEIPMLAFVVWSVWFIYGYCDTNRPHQLYIGTALFICAIYTKQPAAFLAPALLVLLFSYRGLGLFRDRHAWITLCLAVIGLLPLVFIQLEFGQFNATVAAAHPTAEKLSSIFQVWSWYAARLPDNLGWPTVVLAVGGLALWVSTPERRIPSKDIAFILAWFVFVYLILSMMSIKETRHGVLLYFPVVLVALLSIERILPRNLAGAVALLLGLGVLTSTLLSHSVPKIDGYRAAADYVVKHAKPNAKILFAGNRDGSFIFNVRAHNERNDLTIVRADKLLLRIAVMREVGVEERDVDAREIATMMNRYGISYIVAVEGFWTDLLVMRRFASVLESQQFETLEKIDITANIPHTDRKLVIYRNKGPLSDPPEPMKIELLMIGRTMSSGK